MTITIHLNTTIIVPLIITALAIITVVITAFLERNDNGLFAGFGTFLVFIASASVTLTAWIVWILLQFIK
jgi:hypothetical protein